MTSINIYCASTLNIMQSQYFMSQGPFEVDLLINFVFCFKTSSHFRLLLVLFTVLMPLLNGMKIVELYLAVNQHVKTFIFSNPFLSTAKVLIRALKLFARMRWIVNCKQPFEYQNLKIHKN